MRSPVQAPLKPRSEAVLRTLVEAYLGSGEPVGSGLLSRRFPEPISSATIRNVLADLEEESLVSQPHTSAGRIPTERAYRWYVDRWVRPSRPDPATGQRLREALEGLDQDREAWLRHASRVLSEVMGGICVALPLHLRTSRLLRLDFVPLPPSRIVAIWVGASGEVEHQVMDNGWDYDPALLTELGNFASARFSGCSLEEMRQGLLHALQDQADEARQLLQRLSELASRLAEPDGPPPVVVSGLGELGRQPEFGDTARFRELVEAFEEHQRLARLLNAFAESAAAEVTLLLGSENPFLAPMPLATALRTVALPEEQVAFALVGPLRCDYGRVLGGLAWLSEALARRGPHAV